MDHEDLVHRAVAGDVRAFVELTRRFQHFAFGSALALVRDFQQAEDVVQEAFMAAWSALPSLADPGAFPGWLRGIVRHHALRVLRRKDPTRPLSDADQIASEEPGPEHLLEHRQRAATALCAMAELPDTLREAATLFFVHECSHQDIATFLNLSVTTVNNRLHAARSKLKRRMLTMVTETLQSHGLPDDFANRIGRLIGTRGNMVEMLFDPAAMPDILAELSVSDEANRRAVNVQVVQRPSPGVVRGIATSPIDLLPHGSTVMSSGRHALTPVGAAELDVFVRSLTGNAVVAEDQLRLLDRHQGNRCHVSARRRRHACNRRRCGRRPHCAHGGAGAATERRVRAADDVHHDARPDAGMAGSAQAGILACRGAEKGRL